MTPKTLDLSGLPDEAYPFDLIGRDALGEEKWRLSVETPDDEYTLKDLGPGGTIGAHFPAGEVQVWPM